MWGYNADNLLQPIMADGNERTQASAAEDQGKEVFAFQVGYFTGILAGFICGILWIECLQSDVF